MVRERTASSTSKAKITRRKRAAASMRSTNAKTTRKKRVAVTYEAPEAQSVTLTGSFCDWETDNYIMKKDQQGVWKRSLTLTPGQYEYRFIVDGEWRNDPQCDERTPNTYGTENCVLRIEA